MTKKKYTIIYSEHVGPANHRNSVVRLDRVETENLEELIKVSKYNGCSHYIFEGWPALEGESPANICWVAFSISKDIFDRM